MAPVHKINDLLREKLNAKCAESIEIPNSFTNRPIPNYKGNQAQSGVADARLVTPTTESLKENRLDCIINEEGETVSTKCPSKKDINLHCQSSKLLVEPEPKPARKNVTTKMDMKNGAAEQVEVSTELKTLQCNSTYTTSSLQRGALEKGKRPLEDEGVPEKQHKLKINLKDEKKKQKLDVPIEFLQDPTTVFAIEDTINMTTDISNKDEKSKKKDQSLRNGPPESEPVAGRGYDPKAYVNEGSFAKFEFDPSELSSNDVAEKEIDCYVEDQRVSEGTMHTVGPECAPFEILLENNLLSQDSARQRSNLLPTNGSYPNIFQGNVTPSFHMRERPAFPEQFIRLRNPGGMLERPRTQNSNSTRQQLNLRWTNGCYPNNFRGDVTPSFDMQEIPAFSEQFIRPMIPSFVNREGLSNHGMPERPRTHNQWNQPLNPSFFAGQNAFSSFHGNIPSNRPFTRLRNQNFGFPNVASHTDVPAIRNDMTQQQQMVAPMIPFIVPQENVARNATSYSAFPNRFQHDVSSRSMRPRFAPHWQSTQPASGSQGRRGNNPPRPK